MADANSIDTSPLTGREIAYIASIEPVGVNPSAIGQSTITFAVSGDWLSQQGITPENIVLMRDYDGQWSELITAFDHQDGDTYYFTATTPGFSYFAITTTLNAKTGNTTLSGTGTVPVFPIVSSGVKVSSVVTTPEFAAVPVTPRTTTVPASGTSPVHSSGIPVFTVIAGIVGISIVLFAGFLIRRWWIRRQNPALFRKYD